MFEVFIAEDEPPIAEMVAEMVDAAPGNFRASVIAHDGQTMLGILAKRLPDLLLVDIRMPGMNGLALIQAALALDPDLICIVLTSHAQFDYACDALRYGAFDYILKTELPDNLNEVLGRAEKQLILTKLRRERERIDRLIIRPETAAGEAAESALPYQVYQAWLCAPAAAEERSKSPDGSLCVLHDFGSAAAGTRLFLACYASASAALAGDLRGIAASATFSALGHFQAAAERLLELADDGRSGAAQAPSDALQAASRLKDYLDQRVRESFDLTGAALGGYNELYLSRIFKASFGLSPKRYHTEAKIDLIRARVRENPRLLLKEIAAFVGFSDELYLAKVFKQKTGQTFSEYRSSCGG
jgi:two-component system response regulator YesN